MKKEKIGLLLNDNSIVFLDNISNKENSFEIDAKIFYKYLPKLKAIIHTHNESCEPSIIDEVNMIYWNVPWIITSKKCIKAYTISSFRVFEIDINSLISKELKDLLMKLL
ncbi:hypothetical protein SJAV_23730 [Sulfurisphaera javensis]|uniref:JAB domain-containing protein n=1 Tax=Sulfurisphaera javensis TaxID=2049879 RepID=A0AAT9GU65_9CREN